MAQSAALMTAEQVAAILNVKVSTVHVWNERGLLPGQDTPDGLRWQPNVVALAVTRYGPLLSRAQAAELLGCSERTVRRLVAAGLLPTERTGRRRIRLEDVDRYAAQRMLAESAQMGA